MFLSGKPVCFSDSPHLSTFAKPALAILVALVAFGAIGCSKKVVVPDVNNQDMDQAKKTLEAVSLKTGNITGVSGSVPSGAYVVSQNPKPGEQVRENSAVDLVIEAPVLVPDFTKNSVTVTDAVNQLQALGLKVDLVKQPTLSPAGILRGPRVVRQEPSADTPVHHSSLVTLTVESPPDVSGLLDRLIRDPSYEKLNPEYRSVLDGFLK
jgi:beta-lactam-binding protein with PASTA domain